MPTPISPSPKPKSGSVTQANAQQSICSKAACRKTGSILSLLPQPMYLLLPIGATLLVIIQVALWQFAWLRLAQRGGHWRALAEYFSTVVRYPVVRRPHEWE